MNFFILKFVIRILICICMASSFACKTPTKGPGDPPQDRDAGKYRNAYEERYYVNNYDDIKLPIFKTLRARLGRPNITPYDISPGISAYKSSYKEKILDMNVIGPNLLSRLSLLVSWKANADIQSRKNVTVTIKYCIAKSCGHCDEWEEGCFYDTRLEDQLEKIINGIFDDIAKEVSIVK